MVLIDSDGGMECMCNCICSFFFPVETPGWRINVLTNRYQLEGTEVSNIKNCSSIF